MYSIRLSVIVLGMGLLANSFPCCLAQVLGPAVPEARHWTDSSGRFHTMGTLIGGNESQVCLLKTTGSRITVAVARLSVADQQFVSNSLAVGVARRKADSLGDTESESLRLKPLDSISIPMAWLNDIQANWPAKGKTASIGNGIGQSIKSPLLSENAERLPENMIYVRVSAAFLQRFAQKDVLRSAPVQDNILGSYIVGRSETAGHTEFALQSNTRAALGILRLFGTTNSQTIGYAGPVQVFSSSATEFQSAKTIWIDGQGIHLEPAATTAQTHSTITGIQTSLPRLRGRIALRIAGNRVAESHSTAEAISAQHASRRVSRGFDESTDEKLTKLWKAFAAQAVALPASDPLRPREWRASSTKEMVQLVAIGAPGDGSGYVPAPTTRLGTADVQMDIHVAVVKSALADAALKKSIRPAIVLLASMERSEPVEAPQIRWSADGNWLSLTWDATALPPEPSQDKTAAIDNRAH